MTISEIKHFIKQRGIDLNTRVGRENGGQYLYNLLFEFNDLVKRDSKEKIIQHIKKYGLED
jgi:hypothetical protein